MRVLLMIVTVICGAYLNSAQADDLVVTPGSTYTDVFPNTCAASTNASFFIGTCSSNAIVFNRDTSEIYECGGIRNASIRISDGVLYARTGNASCGKVGRAFPSSGKYSMHLEANLPKPNASKGPHLLPGYTFWVVDSNTHIRFCVFMSFALFTKGENYFECFDAPIQ